MTCQQLKDMLDSCSQPEQAMHLLLRNSRSHPATLAAEAAATAAAGAKQKQAQAQAQTQTQTQRSKQAKQREGQAAAPAGSISESEAEEDNRCVQQPTCCRRNMPSILPPPTAICGVAHALRDNQHVARLAAQAGSANACAATCPALSMYSALQTPRLAHCCRGSARPAPCLACLLLQ